MRVLIVDEETAFTRVLSQHLVAAGYSVAVAVTAAQGLAMASETPHDVILLDVRLPDMDGREACARLRAVSRVPIIIVSALGQEQDIVRGLNAGADDYVVKPFRIRELIARIQVQTRRSQSADAVQTRYDDGVLSIDLGAMRIEKCGQRVHLSRIEFRMLAALVEATGRVVSVDDLARAAWGAEEEADERRVALCMTYLRRKVEDDPRHPTYLHTVRGHGYWFGKSPQPWPSASAAGNPAALRARFLDDNG